jgi:hypothetical protein
MNFADESIGKFLKLVSLVFGEEVLFVLDFSPFGFVFFRLVFTILNSNPFFVMN